MTSPRLGPSSMVPLLPPSKEETSLLQQVQRFNADLANFSGPSTGNRPSVQDNALQVQVERSTAVLHNLSQASSGLINLMPRARTHLAKVGHGVRPDLELAIDPQDDSVAQACMFIALKMGSSAIGLAQGFLSASTELENDLDYCLGQAETALTALRAHAAAQVRWDTLQSVDRAHRAQSVAAVLHRVPALLMRAGEEAVRPGPETGPRPGPASGRENDTMRARVQGALSSIINNARSSASSSARGSGGQGEGGQDGVFARAADRLAMAVLAKESASGMSAESASIGPGAATDALLLSAVDALGQAMDDFKRHYHQHHLGDNSAATHFTDSRRAQAHLDLRKATNEAYRVFLQVGGATPLNASDNGSSSPSGTSDRQGIITTTTPSTHAHALALATSDAATSLADLVFAHDKRAVEVSLNLLCAATTPPTLAFRKDIKALCDKMTVSQKASAVRLREGLKALNDLRASLTLGGDSCSEAEAEGVEMRREAERAELDAQRHVEDAVGDLEAMRRAIRAAHAREHPRRTGDDDGWEVVNGEDDEMHSGEESYSGLGSESELAPESD